MKNDLEMLEKSIGYKFTIKRLLIIQMEWFYWRESIEMIMDSGDDVYETLTFSQLEREASDSSSKKAINLMTKLAR